MTDSGKILRNQLTQRNILLELLWVQKSGQICPGFRRTQGLNVPLNQFTCVNILEGKQIYVSRSWRFLAVMKELQMLLSWPENAKARLSMRVRDDDSTELVSFWWMQHLIKTSRFRAKAASDGSSVLL